MGIRISSNVPVVGGKDPIIREYTSNATWTKPTGLYAILVVCVGAGGGGGGGSTESDYSAGGGGGAGGAIVYRYIRNTYIGNNCTVTIGSGGTGGGGSTVPFGSGDNGTNGGDTSFVSNSQILVKAKGGGYGGGSYGSSAQGGFSASTIDSIPAFGPFTIKGGAGGAEGQGGLYGLDGADP